MNHILAKVAMCVFLLIIYVPGLDTALNVVNFLTLVLMKYTLASEADWYIREKVTYFPHS